MVGYILVIDRCNIFSGCKEKHGKSVSSSFISQFSSGKIQSGLQSNYDDIHSSLSVASIVTSSNNTDSRIARASNDLSTNELCMKHINYFKSNIETFQNMVRYFNETYNSVMVFEIDRTGTFKYAAHNVLGEDFNDKKVTDFMLNSNIVVMQNSDRYVAFQFYEQYGISHGTSFMLLYNADPFNDNSDLPGFYNLDDNWYYYVYHSAT